MKCIILSFVLVGVIAGAYGQASWWYSQYAKRGAPSQVVKGYWPAGGEGGACHWTGCVSNRLPAFCPAGLQEADKKFSCPKPNEIDVKCCRGGGGGGGGGSYPPHPSPPADVPEISVPIVPAPQPTPDPNPGHGGHHRCFTTGCAPLGLKHYCGAGIVEVSRKTCISGRVDVTCCTVGGGDGGSNNYPPPAPAPLPEPPVQEPVPEPQPEPVPVPQPTPDPHPGNGGARRCFTTGCAPLGLKHYCGAGIVEVSRKTCISGRVDVTCCTVDGHGNGGGNSGTTFPGPGIKFEPAPAPYPDVPAPGNPSGNGHNPKKGYWDPVDKRCSWTGCAPRGLPAFCAAATKESGTKDCADPGLIDVKCCL